MNRKLLLSLTVIILYRIEGDIFMLKALEWLARFVGKYMSLLVVVFALWSFLMPDLFKMFGGGVVNIMLGIVMFGMGLTLRPVDFKVVATHPMAVVIGLVSQFTIMPLLGLGLAYALNLPPELAIGLVLLGSVPGGTSSNVMVFLSKGDTALSVAMTSVSTLLAPIMTPSILYLLANQWMPVNFYDMFLSIVKIIIVPIALGLVIHLILPKVVEAGINVVPIISVAAVILIIVGVVSNNTEKIAASGLLAMVAVILHNGLGYLLGYFAAKLFRFQEGVRRAIAIEIGMQNSGLATTLATTLLGGGLTAIPGALASVWQNISGSLLASFWATRPPKDEAVATVPESVDLKQ
jgi:BASS family bile acid:Na+ symporter